MNDGPAEFALSNSRVIDFRSAVNDRDFRLFVALPLFPPPPAGYRIFYVLDGNGYFASAAEAVRWNMNAPDVVVVGVGYPLTDNFVAASEARHGQPASTHMHLPPHVLAFIRERAYDLSLPITKESLGDLARLGCRPDLASAGGVDAFLETIEKDVATIVSKIVPIARSGGALFGHSLGGLAVLRALFTRPQMVRTFIAASPAIWWARKAVLEGEAAFLEAVKAGTVASRLLVTMGEEESSLPRRLPPGTDQAAMAELYGQARMVENARELVDRLQQAKGGNGYEVADYSLFAHQNHGISVWPAIGRAVEFAFQR